MCANQKDWIHPNCPPQSLDLIGQSCKQTNRPAPANGREGFLPILSLHEHSLSTAQAPSPEFSLQLPSIFWWPRCRKEKKFHLLSLQCRHTGRKLPKTSLQSRFLFACWPPPSCRSQHGLCAQGSTVIFHCEAGGVPAPDLSWNVKSGERQWCCCKKFKKRFARLFHISKWQHYRRLGRIRKWMHCFYSTKFGSSRKQRPWLMPTKAYIVELY